MPGRTPEQAWRDCRDPIKRAIACLDLSARLLEKRLSEELVFLSTPAGQPIRIKGRLILTFRMVFAYKREGRRTWRMTTRKYDYSIAEGNSPTTEIFGWHWHPDSKRSPVKTPHLHVRHATQYPSRHIPTGRVALEDVIKFAFDELGAAPSYPTALDVLAEIMSKHKKYRSWS